MLSKEKIDIIKSTVPILEQRGTEITTHFYKRMFDNHPELLNIFNHTNQKRGRQQTALANAVYAAAKYIDQLEVILPTAKLIAQKHRSLGIKPEHYPIVGENLLAAIKEVLGDAATDEILSAWKDAYQEIANVFISLERELYKEASSQKGGWEDFKEFEIIKKVPESSLITSFYLKPKDGVPVPSYLPGQYITVRLRIPGDQYLSNRQYSLSCGPFHDYFRISVKKEADHEPYGKVSVYLHEQAKEGDTIEVSVPAGDFVLNQEETNPVALISGGVGITPMMSMLETLAEGNSSREVVFVHAARNEKARAFSDEVDRHISRLKNGKSYIAYSSKENESTVCDHLGHIDKEFLQRVLPKNSICYVCGPVPFMQSVIQHLADIGISAENVRYEFFGPALQLEVKAM
ncbi:NO-inducible flavohemoprotein [Bacillus smithii]|uniref:NO-inducible flavohemoprotein n=1 Tax=Bacillus smithii TaxID=1479 RepID=UPI003D1DFCED